MVIDRRIPLVTRIQFAVCLVGLYKATPSIKEKVRYKSHRAKLRKKHNKPQPDRRGRTFPFRPKPSPSLVHVWGGTDSVPVRPLSSCVHPGPNRQPHKSHSSHHFQKRVCPSSSPCYRLVRHRRRPLLTGRSHSLSPRRRPGSVYRPARGRFCLSRRSSRPAASLLSSDRGCG